MRFEIVHLSDIHFRASGNPVSAVVGQLVSAINSADPSPSLFLIVVSGDIAFSGKTAEYGVALRFFADLRERLSALRPDAAIEFVSVPGNHDCVLPKSGVKLREALIQGVLPSMGELRQDEALFAQLRKAQAPFNKFRKKLGLAGDWDGRCETVVVESQGRSIQVNLYNTALLSQRNEVQGKLRLPLKNFGSRVLSCKDSSLCLSVFHHSYIWLESDEAVEFRAHIEKTSDIALTGHQHYPHEYYKTNSTGERTLYLEAPALQDEEYAKTSAFRVLVFDWDTQQENVVMFRRSRDMYRRVEESGWRPLMLNRAARPDFRISAEFGEWLNESGTPLRHRVNGLLKLRDIFVFPDLLVRSAGARSKPREIRGESFPVYLSTARRVIFQCPALAGKTCLAKMAFWEISRAAEGVVPLLLNGARIGAASEARALGEIWRTFGEEYDRGMLEEFQQLDKNDRVLIIDDWHKSPLNPEARKEYLALASKYFDRIFLFTDELFQIHELLQGSADSILQFDHATVPEMGHELRGRLIDRWVTLGRAQTGDVKEMNREIETKERLIHSMIDRKTLPSRPFIVLCLLQANEEENAEAAEAGSFGYLYEVLVTGALAVSRGRAQLEKKYNFLSRLAYEMFEGGLRSMPLSRVREIAEQYSKDNLVAVDFPSMLADLELARVLVGIDGNYSFGYPHLIYYFIARYFRDNLGRQPSLRGEIERMADHVSSDEFASILMFIVYFARDSAEIVRRLVENADRIYAEEAPADLDSDVASLNRLCGHPDVEIPERVDVKKNREEERVFVDRVERSAAALEDRRKQGIAYESSLSDTDKFDLAYRYIGLLGQVIRNFPGTLPGPDKLVILRSTYLLGLRVLRVLLSFLGSALGSFRQSLAAALSGQGGSDSEKLRQLADFIILLLARMCTLSVLGRVTSSVGAADLEQAYREALEIVGRSNATELIDLMIKLEHSSEFPASEIRALHKQFSDNAFADTILADVVVRRMRFVDLDNRMRQSMVSLFKLPPNTAALIASPKDK